MVESLLETNPDRKDLFDIDEFLIGGWGGEEIVEWDSEVCDDEFEPDAEDDNGDDEEDDNDKTEVVTARPNKHEVVTIVDSVEFDKQQVETAFKATVNELSGGNGGGIRHASSLIWLDSITYAGFNLSKNSRSKAVELGSGRGVP